MPAPETATPTRLTNTIPATASQGLERLLQGPPTLAVSLGTSSGTAWLRCGSYVLALSRAERARLPNGVAAPGLHFLPPARQRCVVGDGEIRVGEAGVQVTRWWDPRPLLSPVTPQRLSEITDQARQLLGCEHPERLWSSLLAADRVGISDSARGLLGKGEGLTPESDDILVGVLAGLRLLGTTTRDRSDLLRALAPVVFIEAPFRTTALSATLLAHAWKGEVAGSLAVLLRALSGEGDITEAVSLVSQMGASSGVAMGSGALMAADCVVRGALDVR